LIRPTSKFYPARFYVGAGVLGVQLLGVQFLALRPSQFGMMQQKLSLNDIWSKFLKIRNLPALYLMMPLR